jgi:hypothetical protein
VDAEKLDVIDFENGSAELMPPEVEKLANLANALEKRPNLKLLVQGRYSEKKDGKVLKALQLKRFIAERQGRTLAPGDSPDALDFGNVDTRSVLETVFAERYGKGTLDEIKVAAEQASVEDQEKTESSNQEAKIQDPAALWKKLYRRMVDDEPLEESALIQLGESRSQVIVRELLEGMGVSEDRVAVKKPKALKPGRKARAKLTLEVLQANQAKSSSP